MSTIQAWLSFYIQIKDLLLSFNKQKSITLQSNVTQIILVAQYGVQRIISLTNTNVWLIIFTHQLARLGYPELYVRHNIAWIRLNNRYFLFENLPKVKSCIFEELKSEWSEQRNKWMWEWGWDPIPSTSFHPWIPLSNQHQTTCTSTITVCDLNNLSSTYSTLLLIVSLHTP